MSETNELTFDQAVALLVRLRDSGDLFIRIVPPFYVNLVCVPGKAVSLGVDQAAFDKRVKEVEALLAGALFKNADAVVDAALDSREDEEGQEEAAAEIRRKVDVVSDALVDEKLKARYELKIHSKAAAFSSIDWDIKIKVADANVDGAMRIPYATLRLASQREFGDDPFSLFTGRTFESVQVNFTADEVLYLASVLQRVAEMLTREEEKERGGRGQ